MDVEAEFLDGPKAGTTHVFRNRVEPPVRCAVDVGEGVDDRGQRVSRTVVYARDESPYPDGPRWIYLLCEEELETQP